MKRRARFAHLTGHSLNRSDWSREEALEIMQTSDKDLPDLLWAAFEVRREFWGKKVKMCVLQNARSGLCPEDCSYCSQSIVSTAGIDKYGLLSRQKLLEGARSAVSAGAQRYCMVTSGRGPGQRDLAHLAATVREIKAEFPSLEICLSLGLMTETQARQLREAGVGWINHNLNTSRRFYPEICSTHTYDDRVQTLRNVQKAGLSTCSGGIMGMGEEDADTVELALALRELEIDSIPVNFLHPVEGTPLQDRSGFDPLRGLKALCLMRFLNPVSEIRMAAGREIHLGAAAALALYPANSIFVEGYLTTPGQKSGAAVRLIRQAGFTLDDEASSAERIPAGFSSGPSFPSLDILLGAPANPARGS